MTCDDEVVNCQICGIGLGEPADNFEHWREHVFAVPDPQGGIAGYTWICGCGPSRQWWTAPSNALAGLTIHMLDQHRIAI